jgi:hypothetical protein
VKIGKRGYRVTLVGAAALLLAGGSVAVAAAAHGGKGKGKAHAVAKRLVRAGVHADVSLIRADGSTDAFAVDRGTVTASTATSLTLKRADGVSVSVSLSSATVAHGTITVGNPALVFSRNGAAFRVRALGAGAAAPIVTSALTAIAAKKSPIVHLDVKFISADASTGSARFDRGQVTAFDTSSLTIKRADGASVTFTLGANVVIRGHLAVGSRALVVQRDGAVARVFAALAAGASVAGIAGATATT